MVISGSSEVVLVASSLLRALPDAGDLGDFGEPSSPEELRLLKFR